MNLNDIKRVLSAGQPLIFPPRAEGRVESAEETENRTIPASAIVELGDANDKTIKIAVLVLNAVIVGDVDLSHFVFERDFKIESSTFTGSIDFSMALFQHAASFAGTSFDGAVVGRATQ